MASMALFTAAGIYLLMSILAALFFGKHTRPLVILNWESYTGLEGGWGGESYRSPWWATFVRLWVMFFPVFDMLSVFPMVGASLGNNIYLFMPDSVTKTRGGLVLSRLIATVPPILFAAALHSIDTIFDITGLFAFFLQFLIPCALQWASINFCIGLWGARSWETSTSGCLSTKPWIVVTLFFGIFAFFWSLVTFLKSL
eukprot:TRINITY_DN13336_c0_g3_i2.p1 TRINITY_DN13336_c0_g3~~TRINITY_DN13336_c0_g3_i2.p1  ORF type:complete len:199 (+),score=32.06 TRINITY_DN13336_c0_g3_i2:220-816(+)